MHARCTRIHADGKQDFLSACIGVHPWPITWRPSTPAPPTPARNPASASYSRFRRYKRHCKMFRRLAAPDDSRNQLWNRPRVLRVIRKQLAQMLLFKLHHRQINQHETPPRTAAPAPTAAPRSPVRPPPSASRYIKDCERARTARSPSDARFFSRCPAAHARSASPSNETGSPAASEVQEGCDSHRNAATSTNPQGTRNFATRRRRLSENSRRTTYRQRLHHRRRRDRAHPAIVGAALVGGHGCGRSQHAQRPSIRPVSRRIGGPENGHAGFPERSRQMHRPAIDADHRVRSPRRVDQPAKSRTSAPARRESCPRVSAASGAPFTTSGMSSSIRATSSNISSGHCFDPHPARGLASTNFPSGSVASAAPCGQREHAHHADAPAAAASSRLRSTMCAERGHHAVRIKQRRQPFRTPATDGTRRSGSPAPPSPPARIAAAPENRPRNRSAARETPAAASSTPRGVRSSGTISSTNGLPFQQRRPARPDHPGDMAVRKTVLQAGHRGQRVDHVAHRAQPNHQNSCAVHRCCDAPRCRACTWAISCSNRLASSASSRVSSLIAAASPPPRNPLRAAKPPVQPEPWPIELAAADPQSLRSTSRHFSNPRAGAHARRAADRNIRSPPSRPRPPAAPLRSVTIFARVSISSVSPIPD